MSSAVENTERYFNRRAQQFDALYSEEGAWRYLFNRAFRRALYQRVELTVAACGELRDFSVLDVGCGSGRNAVVFLNSGARRVVGVDLSENMIRMAGENSRRHGMALRCEFFRADALTFRFQEHFDVAVALGVFDYIRDPRDLLRRMAQLADEKVIASFPGWSPVRAPLRKLRYWIRRCPVHFWSRRRLAQMAAEAGLRDCQFIRMGGAGWLLVARPSK